MESLRRSSRYVFRKGPKGFSFLNFDVPRHSLYSSDMTTNDLRSFRSLQNILAEKNVLNDVEEVKISLNHFFSYKLKQRWKIFCTLSLQVILFSLRLCFYLVVVFFVLSGPTLYFKRAG